MGQQTEEKIIHLETKLAFQEDLIEQLNDVVTQQQTTIDDLSKKVDKLIKIIGSLDDLGIKNIGDEEPPPHY